MKYLYEKPADMRFVDLCIYIDKHFYDEDPDYDTMYKYMWLIANMLAYKQHYFNNAQDYQDFASSLAYSTYERMIDPNKPKVKSVLNYMKSIMYFRKNAYEREAYSEVIDTNLSKYNNFNTDLFIENNKSRFEDYNREIINKGVEDTLRNTPQIIKSCLPSIYKSDKQKYHNLYISSLLTMLNFITLPNESKNYLEEKLKVSTSFNEVNYYRKHLDTNVILWHLPKSAEDQVRIIINKTKSYLIDEIKGLSNDLKITDEEYHHIIKSVLGGGNNETDY